MYTLPETSENRVTRVDIFSPLFPLIMQLRIQMPVQKWPQAIDSSVQGIYCLLMLIITSPRRVIKHNLDLSRRPMGSFAKAKDTDLTIDLHSLTEDNNLIQLCSHKQTQVNGHFLPCQVTPLVTWIVVQVCYKQPTVTMVRIIRCTLNRKSESKRREKQNRTEQPHWHSKCKSWTRIYRHTRSFLPRAREGERKSDPIECFDPNVHGDGTCQWSRSFLSAAAALHPADGASAFVWSIDSDHMFLHLSTDTTFHFLDLIGHSLHKQICPVWKS